MKNFIFVIFFFQYSLSVYQWIHFSDNELCVNGQKPAMAGANQLGIEWSDLVVFLCISPKMRGGRLTTLFALLYLAGSQVKLVYILTD